MRNKKSKKSGILINLLISVIIAVPLLFLYFSMLNQKSLHDSCDQQGIPRTQCHWTF